MKRFLLTMSLSCFLPAIVGMPSQANNLDSLDNLDTSPSQSKLVAQAAPETPGSTTVDPSAAPAGDKAAPDKEKDKVDPALAPAGDKATPDKPAPDKAMPVAPDATTPTTPLTPPSDPSVAPAGDKATPDKPAPDKVMPVAPDATTPTTPLTPPSDPSAAPAGDKATPEKAPEAPGIVPSDAPVPPPGADPSMSPAPASVKPAGDGIRRFMRSSTQGAPNAAAQAELEKVKAESAAFLESVKNPNASQLDQSAGGASYPSPTW
jgi:hypothetical protein